MPKERQPTVRDVARVAGVSPATVTNVLHGRTQRISPQTRDRVLQAIRDIRYRPKPHSPGRGEVGNRTLGFVLQESSFSPHSPLASTSYSGEIFGGVLATTVAHGWVTSVFVETYWSDIGQAIRSRYDGRADAVILMASTIDNDSYVSFVERGVPTIIVGSSSDRPGVSTVDITNQESAAELTLHLVELGHRRIAYIAPSPRQYSMLERAAGVRSVTDEHGLDRDECPILAEYHPVVETPHWDEIPLAVKNEFRLHHGNTDDILRSLYGPGGVRPTAIVAWNHDVAVSTLSGLRELGLRVPEDVSVAAFDDTVAMREGDPPVTVIRQPLTSIGKRAAGIAIQRVLDPTVGDEQVRFSGELVVRSSTAPPSSI
ncbi:MAG: LacI family DNA-binding transcriptional regulator [Fimbriimonadaceae bacterium]